MLPAITDFFQTTLTDNLTKFLQPTYITVASIFILLNLLFVFPNLVSHNILFAVSLLSLNAVVQTILVAVIILVLAYLLLSTSSAMLSFITGESWSESLLGRLLTSLQVREWKRLREQSEKDIDAMVRPERMTEEKFEAFKRDQELKANIARLEKMTRFPEEEEHIGPTALGNVISATASYTWGHYQMDMAALWPHMEIAIAKVDDTELKKRLDNEKTTLDFLVSLAFMLGLFTVEQVLVQFCWLDHDLTVLLGPLVMLILAFIVYRIAVVQARRWGNVVQIAFDTHRNDLKMLLGVRDFSNGEDERNVWQKVSSLLLWNDKADEVFVEQPSVIASPNVKVEVHTSILDIAQPEQETLQQHNGVVTSVLRVYAYIHYVLLISNTSNMDAANANNTGEVGKVYLLISDRRVARIEKDPIPTQCKEQFSVEVVRTTEYGKVDALLWCISGLKGNGSTVLSYKLPMYFFKATVNNSNLKMTESLESLEVKTHTHRHKFSLNNDGPNDIVDVTIEVFDNHKSAPTDLHGDWVASEDPNQINRINPSKFPEEDEQYSYRWKIGKVASKGHWKLSYDL